MRVWNRKGETLVLAEFELLDGGWASKGYRVRAWSGYSNSDSRTLQSSASYGPLLYDKDLDLLALREKMLLVVNLAQLVIVVVLSLCLLGAE